MLNMARLTRFMVLVLAGGMLGCGSDGKDGSGAKGLSRDQADSLNAEHSRFEKAEDPAITAQTRFAAGQLAESQGNTQVAIGQYEAALQTDGHHQASLYRLGVLYAEAKAYPKAIASWEKYIEETRGDATIGGFAAGPGYDSPACVAGGDGESARVRERRSR